MEKIKELDGRKESKKEVFKSLFNKVSLLKFAILLVLLKVVDVATTYYALSSISDAQEINPVVVFAISKMGLIPAMFAVLCLYIVVIYRIYTTIHRTRHDKINAFIAIFILMFLVDFNNIGWLIFLS